MLFENNGFKDGCRIIFDKSVKQYYESMYFPGNFTTKFALSIQLCMGIKSIEAEDNSWKKVTINF